MSVTSARICANVSAPTCSTRSASAIVRWTCAAGQATRSPRRNESRASAASSGSTPTTVASGRQARMAAAMPEISPPPLTGTTTRSACGQSSAISSPIVPCPAITLRSSNGGISTYPCLATSFVGGGDPGGQRGCHGHELGTVVRDRVGLDPRGRARHHHHGMHAEQGGGVGHRVAVIAARMGNGPALPRRPAGAADRGVGTPQLERASGLERLGLIRSPGRNIGNGGRGCGPPPPPAAEPLPGFQPHSPDRARPRGHVIFFGASALRMRRVPADTQAMM